MASHDVLASDAETSAMEASRALNRLAEIGGLLRLGHGRYAINPHVGWARSLAKRKEAIGKTRWVCDWLRSTDTKPSVTAAKHDTRTGATTTTDCGNPSGGNREEEPAEEALFTPVHPDEIMLE